MTHNIKEPYAVQINVKELNTSGRRAETARLILSGKTKPEIVAYLCTTFGMEYKQALSEWRQGYVYIYQNCEVEKEEIRQLSLARLEELFQRAEVDAQLEAKEYYRVQMKNIDLTGKIAGLYDQVQEKQNVSGDITISFNGAKSSENTKQ